MYQKQWSTFIFIVCSQKDATEEEKSQSCEGGQGSSCKKWVSAPFINRRIKGNDPTLASSLSLFYLYSEDSLQGIWRQLGYFSGMEKE